MLLLNLRIALLCKAFSAKTSGRGSAWLERLVRDQEVGGSNPLAPTKFFQRKLLSNQRLSSTYDEGSPEPSQRRERLVFGFRMQILDG